MRSNKAERTSKAEGKVGQEKTNPEHGDVVNLYLGLKSYYFIE